MFSNRRVSACAILAIGVLIASAALAQPKAAVMAGAPTEGRATAETPRQACWSEYKGLLRDCNSSFSESAQRSACYTGAGIALRQCLDAIGAGGAQPRTGVVVPAEGREYFPAWPYGAGSYPVSIAFWPEKTNIGAMLLDCEEERALRAELDGTDLTIHAPDPRCPDDDVTLIITFTDEKTGALVDAIAIALDRDIPCDANQDNAITQEDLVLVVNDYEAGKYDTPAFLTFLANYGDCAP